MDGILKVAGKEEVLHEKGIVSVDGKVSGSGRKNGEQGMIKALQTLNVFSNDYRICLAQKFIGEKALKRNQSLFYEEVRAFFDEECIKKLEEKEGCYKKTVELEHGGTATRKYYVTKNVGWYSEKEQWKGLKNFGMVYKKNVKPDESYEEETRYYSK